MKYTLIWICLLWPLVGSTQPLNAPAREYFTGACGSERMDMYLPLLTGKSVGVVANQTSLVNGRHLVDTLMSRGIRIQSVFAPEHGFRGESGAGETIADGKDTRTGLKVVSLYGKNKKPTPAMLEGIDVLVFDIQDVGARFYTYISTLHYVMEAAAEKRIPLVVLDRPNPNGFYVDGPVLDPAFSSFVGMDPIPLVHGLTVGELAQMINGEHWLASGLGCDLHVIPCDDYSHNLLYDLPVNPSPNLQSMSGIYLYPSLGLFEGTVVSVGRGTEHPFECLGYPGNTTGQYSFVPKDIAGIAVDPPHEGQVCTGHLVKEFGQFYFISSHALYLEWLTGLYEAATDKAGFFLPGGFFDKLAGTDVLRKQLEAGMSASDIRKSWEPDLQKYKQMRLKYLLYPDFE